VHDITKYLKCTCTMQTRYSNTRKLSNNVKIHFIQNLAICYPEWLNCIWFKLYSNSKLVNVNKKPQYILYLWVLRSARANEVTYIKAIYHFSLLFTMSRSVGLSYSIHCEKILSCRWKIGLKLKLNWKKIPGYVPNFRKTCLCLVQPRKTQKLKEELENWLQSTECWT